MKIYTSYFAKSKNIPEDIIKISIAGKAPIGYQGIEYKKLAPKYGFFMKWKETQDNNFYIEHFNSEVLDTLNAAQVYSELEQLSKAKDCVLLCYEKPSNFCHRHLVANWFKEKLNISVEEYRY